MYVCMYECEARDEGRRKIKLYFSSPSSRATHSFRASCKMPRSPRLTHKAPVMQAISVWNVRQIRNKSFVTAAVNGTIKCINTDNRFYMEQSSSNQSWCCFNFTDSFFKETTAELVKSPASLFHQPLHDRACRHVHSFPSGNLHITEDKQNDLEEYKDDFMDESVARVKEERAKDAGNIFIFHLNVNSLQNKIE